MADATAGIHCGPWRRGGGVAARGAGAAAGGASDRVPQRPVREHALGGGLSDSPLPETLTRKAA
jgi:hypothetical protein